MTWLYLGNLLIYSVFSIDLLFSSIFMFLVFRLIFILMFDFHRFLRTRFMRHRSYRLLSFLKVFSELGVLRQVFIGSSFLDFLLVFLTISL